MEAGKKERVGRVMEMEAGKKEREGGAGYRDGGWKERDGEVKRGEGGFESVLVACCGTGGKYNFDHRKKCGTQGVQSCSDPRKYISWDGLQESHKHIAKCQNPGGLLVANTLFGSAPSIPNDILAKAFQLDKSEVEKFQAQF
ncbi:hypothetical protein DKX38_026251 [Salix brachista]|uniref:Cupin type-1 domain-containing protein n=1 Tax=Salix brachista TaxID=2182728 RepID=A0A5N5JRX2_9ROSI|nr:hypothetical protein DKX38_026251 [Salix brachista]